MNKLEFSLLGNADENLIKILAREAHNKMYLELLTKTNSLYKQSVIVELTAEDLLEIITKKYNEEE